MTHSENIADLAKALADAQGEMMPVAFDRDNPFYHSRYATLTALREAMRPVFAQHGLSVVQAAGESGGIETTILHASGQWITAAGMTMRPGKDDPQGIGSLITYARRYGLAAAVGLVADEDDDANAATAGKANESAVAGVKPPASVADAGTPVPSTTGATSVNAGVSQNNEPVDMEGTIDSEIRTKTVQVKGKDAHLAEFSIRPTEHPITCVQVTAWHEAAAQAAEFAPGSEVRVVGVWHVYRDLRSIYASTVEPSIPF